MAQNKRAWLTGDTLTPQTGRVLIIPGDLSMIMAVNGALLELTFEKNWEQFGSLTPEQCAVAMRTMYFQWIESMIPPGGFINATEALILPTDAAVETGAAQVVSAATANFLNIQAIQNPSSNGDSMLASRYLAAGDYEFRHVWARTTSAGILYVTLIAESDSTTVQPIGGLDMFGATLANQRTTGFFTLPFNDKWFIRFNVVGHNAGSSAYFHFWQFSHLWRVG